MASKMRLGVKIGTGFGLIVLLLAMIGFTGFHSLSGVVNKVEDTEDLNQMVKSVLEARRDEKNFIMRRDEAAITQVAAAVERVRRLAAAAAERLREPGQKQAMAAASQANDQYEQAFLGMVALTKREGDLSAVWRGVGEDFVRLGGQAVKEVLAPGREAAAQANDQQALARWNLAELTLDREVLQRFLLLRISAVYFLMRKTDKEWDSVQENLATLGQGLGRWREMVKDHPDLDKVGAEIAAGIDRYRQTALAYRELFEKQRQADAQMVATARRAIEECDGLRAQQKERMDSQSGFAKRLLPIMAGLGALLGSVLAFLITRAITKPVNRIAAGLTEGSQQVAAASEEISSASQSMAEGASQQAASLEEAGASLEELASMTRRNADNAQRARDLTQAARQVMQTADVSMHALTASMGEITEASEEIGKIIKTIDGIAFQTNLLALNAAVEAARAGEAGAGFAVVAEEVRSLALRAGQAARSTADLIEGAMRKIKGGADLVSQTNQVFGQVASSNQKIAGLVEEIASASSEQTQGIDQINIAVAQLDKVSEQAAANAQQTASASEQLSAQAETLFGMCRQLMELVHGAGRRPPALARRRQGELLLLAEGVGH